MVLASCARMEDDTVPSIINEPTLLSPEFVWASGRRSHIVLDTRTDPVRTTLDYSSETKRFKWTAGDGITFMSNVQNAEPAFDQQQLTYVPGGKFEVDVDEAATLAWCFWPVGADGLTPTAVPFTIDPVQIQSAAGQLNGAFFPLAGKGSYNEDKTRADIKLYPLSGVLAIGVWDSDAAGIKMKALRIIPTENPNFAGTAEVDLTGEGRAAITAAVSDASAVQVTLTTPYSLPSAKSSDYSAKVFASLARQRYHSVTFEVEDINGTVYRKATGSSSVLDLQANDIVPVTLDIHSSLTRVSPEIRGAASLSYPCYAASVTSNYNVFSPTAGKVLSVACTDGGDWISNLSVSSLGVLSFDISENTASTERVAELTLSYDGAPDLAVTVTQARKDFVQLDLDSADLSVSEEVTVSLTSNCSWTLTVPEYVSVSALSGTGNATLRLKLEEPVLLSFADKMTVAPDAYPSETVSTDLWSAGNASTYIIVKPGRYKINTIRPDGTRPVHAVDDAFDWWTKTQQNIYRNAISNNVNLSKLTENLYVFDVYGPNNSINDTSLSTNSCGEGGYGTVVFYDNKTDYNIVWSVTLWETPEIHSVKIGDDVWLDRNIGAWETGIDAATATAAGTGLYYQWGRKDPFPGPKTDAIAIASRNYNATAAENALTGDGDFFMPLFYSGERVPVYSCKEYQDEERTIPYTRADATLHPMWFFNNALEDQANQEVSFTTLWRDDLKTADDPCPPGYKVPSWTQMLNLINTLNAADKTYPSANSCALQCEIDGTPFILPASGQVTYGRLNNPGYRCYYWTSTYTTEGGAFTRAKVLGQQSTKGVLAVSGDYSYDQVNRAKPIRCVKMQ